jgi:hypothetical protein
MPKLRHHGLLEISLAIIVEPGNVLHHLRIVPEGS